MFDPVTPSRAISTIPADIRSNYETKNLKEIVKLSGLPITRKVISPFFRFSKGGTLEIFFSRRSFYYLRAKKKRVGRPAAVFCRTSAALLDEFFAFDGLCTFTDFGLTEAWPRRG